MSFFFLHTLRKPPNPLNILDMDSDSGIDSGTGNGSGEGRVPILISNVVSVPQSGSFVMHLIIYLKHLQ